MHRLSAGALLVGLAVAAGPAQEPPLAALSRIEPGEWQLREIGTNNPPETLCVTHRRVLLQLRHRTALCSRFVIADLPDSATVHYTCPGAGHGRTSITVETGRLIKIETQGIADGAPFDFEYEGRRTGDCPATAAIR